MLENLLNKFQTYTQEKCDKFHHYVTRDPIEGQTIWEIENNGYYIIRYNRCYFISNKGTAYILGPTTSHSDWNTHVKLYDLVSKTNECRIDIPVSYTVVNDKLCYKIYQRPNYEFGRDYHMDVFDGLVDDNYFLEYIDNVQSLIINMLNVSNTLPSIGITPMKRFKDSIGYFWTDFKRWTLPKNQFVDSAIDSINTCINYLEINNLGKFNKTYLIDTAKKKWTTI